MTKPIRVLELRSVRGTGGGPEKTILNGAALANPAEFAITVCYIRDRRDGVFAIDDWARTLGVDYVEIWEKHSLDYRVWPSLRQLVSERDIDIVHAHEYKTDLLAYLLGKRCGIVPLSTAHGWTGHSRREQFYYAADKRLLSRFPRVIAVSSEIRDVLLASGAKPERVTTVLNGIDPERFRANADVRDRVRESLGIGAGATVLGAVGRLEPQKRFELLIEAFAEARKTLGDSLLYIVGEGSDRSKLEDAIARLGLTDCCRLLGHRTDIKELYQAFDLFVQSSDYEGTPNVVLEAMALEVPIVATTAGGTAEVLAHGECGLLLPPGDSVALCAAIRRALADPVGTHQRKKSARLRVEGELSFANRVRKVEAIYRDLIERGRP